MKQAGTAGCAPHDRRLRASLTMLVATRRRSRRNGVIDRDELRSLLERVGGGEDEVPTVRDRARSLPGARQLLHLGGMLVMRHAKGRLRARRLGVARGRAGRVPIVRVQLVGL